MIRPKKNIVKILDYLNSYEKFDIDKLLEAKQKQALLSVDRTLEIKDLIEELSVSRQDFVMQEQLKQEIDYLKIELDFALLKCSGLEKNNFKEKINEMAINKYFEQLSLKDTESFIDGDKKIFDFNQSLEQDIKTLQKKQDDIVAKYSEAEQDLYVMKNNYEVFKKKTEILEKDNKEAKIIQQELNQHITLLNDLVERQKSNICHLEHRLIQCEMERNDLETQLANKISFYNETKDWKGF